MNIINIRFKFCISAIILSCCMLFVLLWIGLPDQQLDPQTEPPEMALTICKNTPVATNYSQNLTIQPAFNTMALSKLQKHQRKGDWKRILKAKRLKLGFGYSKGRTGVEYVLGVPTVHREYKSYLEQTLLLLIDQMDEIQRRNSLIVIYIGETSVDFVEQIWQEINGSFAQHLADGFIDVIAPPANYYPDFESLYVTLNDDPERVRWRTKQNFDYMFLMTYAHSRGSYYLQLEDDIKPSVGYFDYLTKLTALESQFRVAQRRQWIVISFSELGFIGKLFRMAEIKPFLSYVQIFYNDQPIDWLLQSYVKLRCCRWDSLMTTQCNRDYFMNYVRSAQSQFQHIGVESTLRAKKQERQDMAFDKDSGRLRMQHLRQPFNLIRSHMGTLMLNKNQFEQDETFIWGYMPQMNSLLQYLKRHQYGSTHITIRSGDQNTDKFTALNIFATNTQPLVKLNGSDTQRCGFIMSYTHQIGFKRPYILYFYVRENISDSNETHIFRRFSCGKSNPLAVKIWLLLWSVFCVILN